MGAWLWISSLQYFLAQIVVATAWQVPFSLTRNYISDLGNTECGSFAGLPVCSPWHVAMNASFVILGLTMVAGAWLIRRYFERGRALWVGLGCIAVSGLGTLTVGLSPENVNLHIHEAGALLPFVVGNLGMVAIGCMLLARQNSSWRPLAIFSLLCGLVGSVSATLFFLKTYAGVGIGGVERLATYPLAVWMIVFGAVCLKKTKNQI